jgi:hypothetical protein
MQHVFKAAVFQERFTVMGRALLPLCLGHCYILAGSDNAWMEDRKPLLPDLVFAVSVCSRTFEAALAHLADPAQAVLEASAWGRSWKPARLTDELTEFGRYIHAHAVAPERWIGSGDKKARHPWPLLMAARLMQHLPESRAWNMPMPMAFSIWSAFLEIAGDDSLVTDDERRLIDHINEPTTEP